MYTFKKFNKKIVPSIKSAKGMFINIKNKKILDFTSGWTGFASLGHNNKEILSAIKKQMNLYSHVDYNEFNNSLIEELSLKLNSFSKNKYKIWYSGNSGSESLEAAMKLSYQVHYAQNNKQKIKFIHRSQSFHGATLHPLLVSSIDVFNVFKNLSNNNYIEVPQNNLNSFCKAKGNACICGKDPMNCMGKRENENEKDYLNRSINEIEETIIKNDPDNICAFVGETQLGSLVGDVPPQKNYWKEVSKLCRKYNIHLILDEVYCGMGRSGKMFNFQWDDCEPDFICQGKNTTSGIIPFSFVLSKPKYQNIIINKLGRVSLGHTFQGHSLGAAGTLKLLDIIERDKLLNRVNKIGKELRKIIHEELKNNEQFSNVRGRGFAFSSEHSLKRNNEFALKLKNEILDKYNILLNAKWHRVSFLPSYNMPKKYIYKTVEIYLKEFKKLSQNKKFN